MDFEAAVWKAVPRVFPNVEMKGCSFHWCQCLWRKIEDLGLVVAYKNDPGTFKLCRQLMALPYLPEEHLTPMFQSLCAKVNSKLLRKFMEYIEQTWIHGAVSVPKMWSVFNQAVRTNTDVEGWQLKLN